ncbi:hypothetical protein R5R35_006955 [Gryllus longicercus]|uniref:Uncharacterized protein n=1 Tax=Gryllus longicercus TaxID=2509291 RepID=A0AAN9VR33_9ORTH
MGGASAWVLVLAMVLVLSSATEEEVRAVNKCCAEGQVLDAVGECTPAREGVERAPWLDPAALPAGATRGWRPLPGWPGRPCPWELTAIALATTPGRNLKARLLANASLQVVSRAGVAATLPPAAFCADAVDPGGEGAPRSAFVACACARPGAACVRKCCREGHALLLSAAGAVGSSSCEPEPPATALWRPRVAPLARAGVSTSPTALVYYRPSSCPAGSLPVPVMRPAAAADPALTFELLAEGSARAAALGDPNATFAAEAVCADRVLEAGPQGKA